MRTITPAALALLRLRRQPPARGLGYPIRVVEPRSLGFAPVFAFVAIHMAFALVMKKFSVIGGAHALLTLAVGLWLCFRNSPLLQIAQWVAYVAGAEVLWRMCKAPIPWEFAKHSTWLVCLIALVRSHEVRGSWVPALYFAMLVPASAVTFMELPFDLARKEVIFALSGPLCIALCTLLFSSLSLTASGFQRVGVMLLSPVAGAASVVLFGLATREVLFDTASNSATSGGYGPNQVSAMLSLGAVVAVLLHLREQKSNLLKGGLALLALWLLAQAALTFSRTGVYLFVAAIGIAVVFLVQSKGRRLKLLLVGSVFAAVAFAIFPKLDSMTGGKLAERFNDKELTGRDKIAALDLQVWREHPILGAGAGMSMFERAAMGDDHAAHTEYTRLVADHGLLGAIALMILLFMTGQAFLRTRGLWVKAIVSALAVWAFLFMSVSGMRLVAPAFLLGFVHARFLDEAREKPRTAKPFHRSNQASLATRNPTRRRTIRRWGMPGRTGK